MRVANTDAGRGPVVHGARLASDQLYARDGFFVGIVRQDGPTDDVADGINAGHVGLIVPVSFNKAALVHLDPRHVKANYVGERTTPDGHQHHIVLDGFSVSTCRRFHAERDPGIGGLGPRPFGCEL